MKLPALVDYCHALPGATEDIKWGNDQVFSVAGKMFCVFSWKDEKLEGVSFKVPDHRFLEYTDRSQFVPAPYLARAHWVMAIDGQGLTATEMRAALRESHRLVFSKLPKRVQTALRSDH